MTLNHLVYNNAIYNKSVDAVTESPSGSVVKPSSSRHLLWNAAYNALSCLIHLPFAFTSISSIISNKVVGQSLAVTQSVCSLTS